MVRCMLNTSLTVVFGDGNFLILGKGTFNKTIRYWELDKLVLCKN